MKATLNTEIFYRQARFASSFAQYFLAHGNYPEAAKCADVAREYWLKIEWEKQQ